MIKKLNLIASAIFIWLLVASWGCTSNKELKKLDPMEVLSGNTRIMVMGLDNPVRIEVSVATEQSMRDSQVSTFMLGVIGTAITSVTTSIEDPCEKDRRVMDTLAELFGEEHPGRILKKEMKGLLEDTPDTKVILNGRPKPADAVLEVIIDRCSITHAGKGLEFEVLVRLHPPLDWSTTTWEKLYKCGTSEKFCSEGIPKLQETSVSELLEDEGTLIKKQLCTGSEAIARSIFAKLNTIPEGNPDDEDNISSSKDE